MSFSGDLRDTLVISKDGATLLCLPACNTDTVEPYQSAPPLTRRVQWDTQSCHHQVMSTVKFLKQFGTVLKICSALSVASSGQNSPTPLPAAHHRSLGDEANDSSFLKCFICIYIGAEPHSFHAADSGGSSSLPNGLEP